MVIFDIPGAIIGGMFLSGWLSAILSFIFIIALIIEIANEKHALGYASFFVYLIAMSIFTPVNTFTYIWHNPLDIVGFIVIYFALGAVYSTVKYRSWAATLINRVSEVKQQFIKDNNLSISVKDEIPSELTQSWSDALYKQVSYNEFQTLKEGFGPGRHKARILNWIAFWPFSAIGLFIAQPLEDLVNWLYAELVSVYKGIWTKLITSRINMSDVTNLKNPTHHRY